MIEMVAGQCEVGYCVCPTMYSLGMQIAIFN